MSKHHFMGFDQSKRSVKWLNIITALFLFSAVIFFVKPSSDSSKKENINTRETLFVLQGQAYSAEDLPLKYSQPLHEAQTRIHQLKERIIEAAIADIYLQQEQEKTGENRAQLAQNLFQPQVPSDAEMRAFYAQNQQRISAPYEQAKPRIQALLLAQQQQSKQQQLVAKLTDLGELEMQLKAPVAPVVNIDTLDYPAKGADDAKLTLVEFGDYQCHHCKEAFKLLQQQLPDYLDRVRYIYMDFPINSSGISRSVAEGAVCADQQQQFWPYHEMAFKQQDSLDSQSALDFAKALGLDMKAFTTCMTTDATAAKVEASAAQARELGLNRTPSFFLNGRKLGAADLRDGFDGLFESVLSNADNPLLNDSAAEARDNNAL